MHNDDCHITRRTGRVELMMMWPNFNQSSRTFLSYLSRVCPADSDHRYDNSGGIGSRITSHSAEFYRTNSRAQESQTTVVRPVALTVKIAGYLCRTEVSNIKYISGTLITFKSTKQRHWPKQRLSFFPFFSSKRMYIP